MAGGDGITVSGQAVDQVGVALGYALSWLAELERLDAQHGLLPCPARKRLEIARREIGEALDVVGRALV